MTNAPLLGLLAIAAIWPFGHHDRHKQGRPARSRRREPRVEVDTSTPIGGGDAKAMESYKLFLDLASDDELLRAEAMRRLADLELEGTEIVELQGHVQALGSGVGSTIDMYEKLLKSYPDYKKNDLVLYQLARAYEASGRLDESLATLDRLLKEYPQTSHAGEAQFRRGETLFVEKRYHDAELAYDAVLKHGSTSQFHQQSLVQARLVAIQAAAVREEPGLVLRAARREARHRQRGDRRPRPRDDLFANGARRARARGRHVPRALDRLLLYRRPGVGVEVFREERTLGRTRSSSTRTSATSTSSKSAYQDAADAYHAFVKLDPYHAKAPLLQVEVIEAFKKGGFADLVLSSKENFVETYGPGSPYWQRYTFEQQPEVVAHLKSNVTDLAAYHHSQAQQTHDAAEYAAAARWYRTYLQSFPDGPDAGETNFLLAEVLYESGSYHDAAVEYERTAYAYPFHAHAGEAGYAALLAYAKEEERLRARRRRSGTAPASRASCVSSARIRPTRRPPPCRPTRPRSSTRSTRMSARETSPRPSSRARRRSSRSCSARRGRCSRTRSSTSWTSRTRKPLTCT